MIASQLGGGREGFFNVWLFSTRKICQKVCQSRFKKCQTLNKPPDSNFLPKWQNVDKFGHSAPHPLTCLPNVSIPRLVSFFTLANSKCFMQKQIVALNFAENSIQCKNTISTASFASFSSLKFYVYSICMPKGIRYLDLEMWFCSFKY